MRRAHGKDTDQITDTICTSNPGTEYRDKLKRNAQKLMSEVKQTNAENMAQIAELHSGHFWLVLLNP